MKMLKNLLAATALLAITAGVAQAGFCTDATGQKQLDAAKCADYRAYVAALTPMPDKITPRYMRQNNYNTAANGT